MLMLVWVAAVLCCSFSQLQFPGQPSPVTSGLNKYIIRSPHSGILTLVTIQSMLPQQSHYVGRGWSAWPLLTAPPTSAPRPSWPACPAETPPGPGSSADSGAQEHWSRVSSSPSVSVSRSTVCSQARRRVCCARAVLPPVSPPTSLQLEKECGQQQTSRANPHGVNVSANHAQP